MEDKLVKLAIGLAIENAIVHKRETEALTLLYSEPNLERVIELHERLINSKIHFEREIAIWLETGIDLGPMKHNPKRLSREMMEMEVVLGSLINRSRNISREIVDWMNYIANASQFIQEGYWIDAKIFLSKALQCSQSLVVEDLKTQPSMRHEVDILQRATASYFEEMKGYPLILKIRREIMELLLPLQGLMLQLMQNKSTDNGDSFNRVFYKLSDILRSLMGETTRKDAEKELRQLSDYLEQKIEESENLTKIEIVEEYRQRIEDILRALLQISD